MKFKSGDRVVVSKDSRDFDVFVCQLFYVNNPNATTQHHVVCTKK